MKLKYLGTGAAEGMPAIFCDCLTCRTARERGGRDLRTRSQSIIDNRILIDFGPDTYYHFHTYNIPLSKIHSCLITHAHMDHLNVKDVLLRRHSFTHLDDETPLTFYSDRAGCDKLAEAVNWEPREDVVRTVQIPLYTPFEVEGYTVTALRAQHGEESDPVVYLIEKDGRSLLYANDTGGFPEESRRYLETLGRHLHLVSLDCTFGAKDTLDHGHMTISRCAVEKARMLEMGIADESTVFVINHFSHNGEKMLHDELVECAAKEGFLVAYDGLELEI